ncbi:putative F-box/kelch-repeat protein [Cardamine amara subsp. amara]|uniref:F-box/kelch-repeat protein n=1 Tax=Cardamine amara subsp. amara TaxID=228776 RepID=A0ABD0ZS30_CARAN
MMISNLPKELVEEILSRVSFKDLRAVRFTCKNWNAITKDRSFANKQIEKVAASSSSPGENQFVMITKFNIYLIGVNLLRTQNNDFDLSIKRNGTLVGFNSSLEAFHKSSQVIHCNGVFLCVWGNMLVLWNPYWRKTKWFLPRHSYGGSDLYALGYDKFSGSHKILRFFGPNRDKLDFYDLSSNSWSVPDGTLEWDMKHTKSSVSLKGNTYWCAIDEESGDYYLFCFDFTSERFGPPLSLPLTHEGHVYLSAVKEEKLAVLIKMWNTMEIWVTNKIEPDEVSWSIFLKVDMETRLQIGSFLVDEEKKVAVVFHQDRSRSKRIYNNAYIIGENGYFKRVDLRKSPYTPLSPFKCSYVLSSVQIK